MKYDKEDLMQEHLFKTNKDKNLFKNSECSFSFKPIDVAYDGVNVLMLGF